MSVAPEPDFSDRLEFVTDPDAEAVDLDDALADFLIAFANLEEATA